MKTKLHSVWLMIIFLSVLPSGILAQPGEDSLLQAWESAQKNDPKTELFEKIDKNTYAFKTKWFPFDGKLRVLNVTLDERYKNISSEFDYIMGVVEVELIGLPEDFMQKYSYSYSMWTRSNLMYYIEADNKWITSDALYQYQNPEYKNSPLSNVLLFFYDNLFMVIFLIILIFLLGRANKKQQRKYDKYLDRSEDKINKSLELERQALEVNKENLEIQKQILALLKK